MLILMTTFNSNQNTWLIDQLFEQVSSRSRNTWIQNTWLTQRPAAPLALLLRRGPPAPCQRCREGSAPTSSHPWCYWYSCWVPYAERSRCSKKLFLLPKIYLSTLICMMACLLVIIVRFHHCSTGHYFLTLGIYRYIRIVCVVDRYYTNIRICLWSTCCNSCKAFYNCILIIVFKYLTQCDVLTHKKASWSSYPNSTHQSRYGQVDIRILSTCHSIRSCDKCRCYDFMHNSVQFFKIPLYIYHY